ncbi:hypothetical protein [Sphingorhabdus sp. EL138]|uniref:hypothetical protein n=1 Tax=Sphingorhabdus sp. EL138 TaxID=2073156 RepID=UPI000D68D75E|nr:hypothetical protein [Sphingorhabdus sp. EL138]
MFYAAKSIFDQRVLIISENGKIGGKENMISKSALICATITAALLGIPTDEVCAESAVSNGVSVESLKKQLEAEDKLEELRKERYAANRKLKEIAIQEMEIRAAAGMTSSQAIAVKAGGSEQTLVAQATPKETPVGNADPKEKKTKKTNDKTKKENDETKEAQQSKEFGTKFGGIEFGAGIGFSYDLGSNDRVSEAELVNGVVRIKKSDNVQARLMLESHYFFTPKFDLFSLKNSGQSSDDNMWGFGPFVAIQPGGDNLIEAVGGGLMFGFRRSKKSTESFNLGFGVLYDINSKTLGDGILPNEPLPMGETEIRFREQEQSGFLIMSSYSF